MKKINLFSFLVLFLAVLPITIGVTAAAQTPKKDNVYFTAQIITHGPYKAGVQNYVEINLVTKNGYNNDRYAFKFEAKTPAPDWVVYKKNPLTAADGVIDATNAVFKFPFVKSKAGRFLFSGVFSIAEHNNTNHVNEDFVLSQNIDVK